MPFGFCALVLQGVSELIKRIAFLAGLIPNPLEKHAGKTAEQELAEEILRARGKGRRRGYRRAGTRETSDERVPHCATSRPLMFLTLVIVLLLGYPVAFSLAAVGHRATRCVGINLGLLPTSLLQALPDRVWGVMSNDTLLAVPFFTFMGLILERSGMAEDLLDTIGSCSARCAAASPTR